MTRFVISADVALHLAERSGRVQRGALCRQAGDGQLDHLRMFRLRRMGDRVMRGRAWEISAQLGWPDTFVAKHIALTQRQTGAVVCVDPSLARAVRGIVTVASVKGLISGA